MSEWIACKDHLPENGLIVETKIDDADGSRNVGAKLYLDRNLWWMADGSMYVYYTPTHWRETEPTT